MRHHTELSEALLAQPEAYPLHPRSRRKGTKEALTNRGSSLPPKSAILPTSVQFAMTIDKDLIALVGAAAHVVDQK